MSTLKKRPVYLDLSPIRMPVNALVSIAHRVSGVLLFLAMPIVIYYFDMSLRSAQDFSRVISVLDSMPMKLGGLVMLWALLHHMFAGIRYLLLDARIGMTRKASRLGSWAVFAAEVLALVVIAGFLL